MRRVLTRGGTLEEGLKLNGIEDKLRTSAQGDTIIIMIDKIIALRDKITGK